MPLPGKFQTFVVDVEDKPGVLNRVTSLIRRRAFKVESLTMGRTAQPGISRMTISLEGGRNTAALFKANLEKLINVLRVENVSATSRVVRDLALIKVRSNEAVRGQILEICQVFRARVIDFAMDTLIIETTGTEEKVNGLIEVLQPYGIVEMVRTGQVAMPRGKQAANLEAPVLPAPAYRENGKWRASL